MPVIIRGLSGLSKKIKDATATPADIISGKVAYGNDHTRMIGTHVCHTETETLSIKKGEEVSISSPKGAKCGFTSTRIAQLSAPQYSGAKNYLHVYRQYDNVAVLSPEENRDKRNYTFLKTINPNVKLSPDTYLVLTFNNIPLYIHFGRPVVNGSFVEPSSFTSKICHEFIIDGDMKRATIKIAGSGYAPGYWDDKNVEIYIDINNGVITEIGVAVAAEPVNVNRYYSDNDIELSIVHI